jgi:hypothetical protein
MSTLRCVTGKYIAELKHSLFVRKYVSFCIHFPINCLRYEAFYNHKLGTKAEDVMYESLEGMNYNF